MNTKRSLGMNRITALAAVMLMLMFANLMYAQASSAVGGGNGALSITNLQVLPQPVVAGENVTVQFQLYNSYTQTLNNVNLYLQAENQNISLDPTPIIDPLRSFTVRFLAIPPPEFTASKVAANGTPGIMLPSGTTLKFTFASPCTYIVIGITDSAGSSCVVPKPSACEV